MLNLGVTFDDKSNVKTKIILETGKGASFQPHFARLIGSNMYALRIVHMHLHSLNGVGTNAFKDR